MSEPDNKQRLAELDKKLAAFKAEQAAEEPHVEEHYSQASIAWRMVIELMVGLGIGFAIGYGLDELLGTDPWLMIVFTMLGLVAGFRVMMTTAAELQAEQALNDGADETNRDTGTDEEGDRNGG